jgi:hypothetical protein
MARLTCLGSVSQWEHEQVSKYPDFYNENDIIITHMVYS